LLLMAVISFCQQTTSPVFTREDYLKKSKIKKPLPGYYWEAALR
jgi:hypothetical protein